MHYGLQDHHGELPVALRRVRRAAFMTGGGYRLLVSADFGGLVLGCINADFCVQILIFSGFSRSTRLSHLRTAPHSKFADFFIFSQRFEISANFPDFESF